MSRLEVQNIVMQFPAIRALDDVSIEFQQGEVHGIVGENGAGKSTLMKIVSGVQHATSGSIKIDGAPVSIRSVGEALKLGIAMIHQELNLVDELTVAENVFLGREIAKGGVLDRSSMIEKTQGYLQRVRASFPTTTKVGELSIAGKQLVEIAKALGANASILIMDEPTAVLSEPEAEALFELVAQLKGQGTTILYISHRLAEVCAICDRITVLRDGLKVTTLEAEGADPAHIADLMVGRELGDFYPPKLGLSQEAPLMEVQGVRGVSFSVRSGEILGVSGLVGAGRTELAEAIVGLRPAEGGAVRIGGSVYRFRNPKAAMQSGVVYVSEDRKGVGLHLSLGSVENVTLANLRAYGKWLLDRTRQRESTEGWKKSMDIRVGDLEAPVDELSGGNQQKIAIAKWLEVRPKVLILDEPTRGVDVGAKREIYNLIQRFAAEGMGCVVISSELTEIIGLCDRAIVMREGRMVGELIGEDLSEEAVMRLAAGVAAA